MVHSNNSNGATTRQAHTGPITHPVRKENYSYSNTSLPGTQRGVPTPIVMPDDVERLRDYEYSRLKDQVYLDHAGTAVCARSVYDAAYQDQMRNLYGNPHSESTPSMRSTQRMEQVREQALNFFNADPKYWDLVFVANSTAAIKLVTDCFADYARANKSNLWYGYHKDAHTSLVGARQLANKHHCFTSDDEVEQWARQGCVGMKRKSHDVGLFAYPGQSNMTGRRLPLQWCSDIKKMSQKSQTYVLLDAAALATTRSLSLDDPLTSPDFVALSFYKIFGWVEIGALLVRKSCSHIIEKRRYFGGGTVDMVMAVGNTWHAKKESSIHEQLEEGTPAFNTIFALGHAMDVHERLYGPDPMTAISRRTTALVKHLYDGLRNLRHSNGRPMVRIYGDEAAQYGDSNTQGATVAMNVVRADGTIVNDLDVITRGNACNVYLRGGSHCNPGGFATHLQWSSQQMQAAYDAGHRCSHPLPGVLGKPTGAVRASLGAPSTMSDVEAMIKFIHSTYFNEVATNQSSVIRTDEKAGIVSTSKELHENRQGVQSIEDHPRHRGRLLHNFLKKLSCSSS